MKHAWFWIAAAACVGAVYGVRRIGGALPDAPLVWPPTSSEDQDDTADDAPAPPPAPAYVEPYSYGGFAL